MLKTNPQATPHQMADELGTTPANVSNQLHTLVKNGVLQKTAEGYTTAAVEPRDALGQQWRDDLGRAAGYLTLRR